MFPRQLITSYAVCSALCPSMPVATAAIRTQMMNASSFSDYFPRRLLLALFVPIAMWQMCSRSSSDKAGCRRYTGCKRQMLPVCRLLLAPLAPIAVRKSLCSRRYPGCDQQMFPRPVITSHATRSACRPVKSVAATTRAVIGKCSPVQ